MEADSYENSLNLVKVDISRKGISKKAVLRIRDILVRIRIRGSLSLTNGSGSCYFVSDGKMTTKIFFTYYFLKLHLHHFSEIKSHKEVTKQ
jgi:hypothetical protein